MLYLYFTCFIFALINFFMKSHEVGVLLSLGWLSASCGWFCALLSETDK